MAHFMDPAAVTPNSTMKPVNLSDAELKELLALMLKLTPENGDVVDSAPEFAVAGALIFQKNSCGSVPFGEWRGRQNRSAAERSWRDGATKPGSSSISRIPRRWCRRARCRLTSSRLRTCRTRCLISSLCPIKHPVSSVMRASAELRTTDLRPVRF